MARAKARTVTPKKWTFLVYMAGDNNLESDGEDDLAEMKQVGSSVDLNVVVQFDRGATRGSTRYCLRKGTSLKADAVAKLGVQNTGDPAGLIDFIKWATSTYPAARYALVLWNHGQGWDDTDIFAEERAGRRLLRPKRIRRAFFRSSVRAAARIARKPGPRQRAILIDDGAKDFLDNLEMKKVMRAARTAIGHKLDLLGMDACLMSMAEVGYQVRASVARTVGSEETEPGAGWPYSAILRALSQKPDSSAEDLGRVVVTKYLDSYRGTQDEVTQSLCDLTKAGALAKAVKALAAALSAALGSQAALLRLLSVRNRVQQYEVRDNVDLVDLCRLLRATPALPAAIAPACGAVIAAATGAAAYVQQSGSLGNGLRHSSGVAIYFPTRVVSPLYAGLDWTKATGWGRFLEAYIEAVQSR